MKSRLLAAFLVAALPHVSHALPASVPDHASALREAKKGKKDVFVFATGDWCKDGLRFKRAILKEPAVGKRIADAFVYEERSEPDVPTQAQLDARAKDAPFTPWIARYPAVVLQDASGRTFGRIGCADVKDLARFLRALDDLQAAKALRDQEWALAEKSDGVARATHLGKGLCALEENLARQEDYKSVREAMRQADPQDAAGYQARLAFNEGEIVEQVVWKFAEAGEFAKAEADLKKRLDNPVLTTPQRQKLLGATFSLYRRWDKKEEAEAQLGKIIALAPDSDMAAGARTYTAILRGLPVPMTDRWSGAQCGEPALWEIPAAAMRGRPGRWILRLHQVEGYDALNVSEAVLLCGGKEIAVDRHEASAKSEGGCTYAFDARGIPAAGTLVVRVKSRCGGWRESNGWISLTREEAQVKP